MTGQTLSYKSYSPILEYTKEFTSLMNSLPFLMDFLKLLLN